jgi:hypothetical protein
MLLADTVAIDCAAAAELAEFWLTALGVQSDEPLNFGVLVVGPQIEMEPVLGPFTLGHSELPYAIAPAGGRDNAARRVDVGQGQNVTRVVLADPEDNEFCVLRSRPSRA